MKKLRCRNQNISRTYQIVISDDRLIFRMMNKSFTRNDAIIVFGHLKWSRIGDGMKISFTINICIGKNITKINFIFINCQSFWFNWMRKTNPFRFIVRISDQLLPFLTRVCIENILRWRTKVFTTSWFGRCKNDACHKPCRWYFA